MRLHAQKAKRPTLNYERNAVIRQRLEQEAHPYQARRESVRKRQCALDTRAQVKKAIRNALAELPMIAVQ